MRISATAALGVALLLLCPWPEVVAKAESARCQSGADAIGVSRTVEIDTTTGPRFGQLQYRDEDLLRNGEIVLTFDDGPSRRHTPAILDALDAHCTKATFFSVGRMAVADPAMLQETAVRGHTIGSHTWSHKDLRSLSMEQARAEVELGLSAVRVALGGPVAPFFRFPYLSDPQRVQELLQHRGIATFSIDVDSFDFRTPSAELVQNNILTQLAQKGKGILLFHDIQPSTARAMPALLSELKARGYRVVHLVPKYAATTVADFDEMASDALTKRQVAGSSNPRANRSVVWPLMNPPSSKASSGRPTRPRRVEPEDNWIERIFRN